MEKKEIKEELRKIIIGLRYSAENLCSGIDESDIKNKIDSVKLKIKMEE